MKYLLLSFFLIAGVNSLTATESISNSVVIKCKYAKYDHVQLFYIESQPDVLGFKQERSIQKRVYPNDSLIVFYLPNEINYYGFRFDVSGIVENTINLDYIKISLGNDELIFTGKDIINYFTFNKYIKIEEANQNSILITTHFIDKALDPYIVLNRPIIEKELFEYNNIAINITGHFKKNDILQLFYSTYDTSYVEPFLRSTNIEVIASNERQKLKFSIPALENINSFSLRSSNYQSNKIDINSIEMRQPGKRVVWGGKDIHRKFKKSGGLINMNVDNDTFTFETSGKFDKDLPILSISNIVYPIDTIIMYIKNAFIFIPSALILFAINIKIFNRKDGHNLT